MRELQNVIERAVILCADGEQLQPAYLGFNGMPILLSTTSGDTSATSSPTDASTSSTPEADITLGDMEKQLIQRTVEKCAGNRTHAARKLGISIRTLRNKIAEYDLPIKGDGDGDDATE